MTQEASQDRSDNYVRQVKGSVIFKGLAVTASFLSIPLMIRYLGEEQYGVWSTLMSVMSWVVFFDLGIGNGLRNKLAESLAKKQTSDAADYVSSGYSWIGALSLLLFVTVASAAFYMPWQRIFNTQNFSNESLRNSVLIAIFFLLLNFWLGLINQIFNAVQKTSVVVLGQLISNATGLLLVFILVQNTKSSMLYLVTAYGISTVLANLVLSICLFIVRPELRPRMLFNRQYIRPLLSIGLQFFVIQIAVLFIFTTDKILIAQLFGPTYVTQYDVVFKIFSILTILHGLVTAPLWSSYTDAFHKGDFDWINATIKKQLKIFAVISLIAMALCFGSRPIINLWITENLEIPNSLIFSMAFFIFISTWNNVFAFALNGMGKIKIQLMTAIFAMLTNIPLSIILVKRFEFGVYGVVLATCLSLSFFSLAGPIQTWSILKSGNPYK